MVLLVGCGALPGTPLPSEDTTPVDESRYTLVARFAHISDSQIVDEESPARLVTFSALTRSAWRPYEAYSTQLLDGTIRAINRVHAAGETIEFVIHTGDATDNRQRNEVDWYLTAMNGGPINPRSGPDDRAASDLPPADLDPHHPFVAQGLYRQGIHGPLASVPWYGVLGNHDHFAVGVFPIVEDLLGGRTSPLPPDDRIGLFYPKALDPTGSTAYGPITPAHPGPPPAINIPQRIEPREERQYVTIAEMLEAYRSPGGSPPGHGFADTGSHTWYSTSPVPGLRLIVLDSSTPIVELPAAIYSEGAISEVQRDFLERELTEADDRGDLAIVATHHPSSSLAFSYGTSLLPSDLVSLLNRHPSVALHLCGHTHAHSAFDRGTYVEITTGSTLDWPQQGRVIELWRAPDATELRYRFFSHLDDLPPLDGLHSGLLEDPLRALREEAAALASDGG